MRTHTLLLLASASSITLASPAAAQRRFRIGPTVSSIAIEDAAGASHSFGSYGGSVGLITGDDGETALTIARYPDLTPSQCVRDLTLYELDSYYYPVGTRGVAPFASTALGLARVTESALQTPLPITGSCGGTSSTSELGLGFGLGVRLSVGPYAAAIFEGRFVQVPNSGIQSLEARAHAAIALGSQRKGEFLEGTLGPAVSVFIPISGALRGRAPFAGVRFRRDTKKAGTVGLEIDFAPLKVTESCSPPGCEPNAVLFTPGYEASVRPAWGRVYGEVGLLIAGVYTQGPDRGVAQGLHGGLGADLYSGRLMWNVNSRLLWLQRNSGENVFGVQLGVSLSPKLGGKGR
ncbi:MAG TPA: hypothetical protein VFU41_07580 [Gemmatimonadales bacterium]|nr:hypothetical protein [Gemmatimonadales bacterium]